MGFSVFIAFLLTLALSPSLALGYSTGIEYATGPIRIKSRDPEEITKKGSMNLIRVFSYADVGRFEFALGLGLQSSSVVGEDSTLGVKQYYELRSPALDVMVHFRLWRGLLLGGVVRNQFGKGASYGVEDENSWVYVNSIGPSLIYRLVFNRFTLSAGISQLTNQPTDRRTATTQNYSVGLSYALKDAASAKSK